MATKLIFGLRAPQATQLVIINEQRDMLSISLTPPNAEPNPERCDHETWTADLTKGDYLVKVEGEGNNGVRFTVTPKAGIVSYEQESPTITAGWALQGAGDPKNPWPPPGDDVYALDGAQWLTDELQKVHPSTITRGHTPHVKDGDEDAQQVRESTAVTREGPKWQ
ncbi:MAG TPA: hypothetical protein VNO30_35630 [Kofleriaceae bacterium]|nr:hypothetical protein [Kofleriaceae bacterium]